MVLVGVVGVSNASAAASLAQWLKPLPVYPAGAWFDPARVHLQFLNSRNVFDWLGPGSIPARVRRKNFRFPASRNPGSNPRHDRVRFLMSLACRLRSERPGFDSGFGSTAIRGIGRCRLHATETQRATPRNYADGRDRRRREAAATALRMVSKMPRQTMHSQHLSVVTRGISLKLLCLILRNSAFALDRFRPNKTA